MKDAYIHFLSLEKNHSRDNFLKYMKDKYSYTEEELIEFWTKQKSIEYDKTHLRKSIRFSQDEFKIIEEKMSMLDTNFSTYAKSVLLDFEIKTKEQKKLLFELNKIGNNINQIAIKLNQNKDIDSLSKLAEVENKLQELLNDS